MKEHSHFLDTSIFLSLTKLRGLKIVDRYDIPTALALYERHAVKFIDALIASFLKWSAMHLTLISYDRDFDKLGVKRVEPAELLKEL